jgi:hypothetical protein
MKLRKLAVIVSASTLVVALGFVGVGMAAAASGGANTAVPAGAKPAAVPHAKPCKNLWAVVNADGSLARAGCPSTTSDEIQTGAYEVIFNRSIVDCVDEATLGLAGSGPGNPAAGMIGVAGRASNNDAEFVEVFNSQGSVSNQGFHLLVTC